MVEEEDGGVGWGLDVGVGGDVSVVSLDGTALCLSNSLSGFK